MPAPATCLITGVAYKPGGTIAPGARLTLTRLVKDGVIVATADETFTADALGTFSFSLIRNSTATLKGNIEGFDGIYGTTVAIPDSASATLESLQPATYLQPASTMTGAGTLSKIAKFNGASSVTDSRITDTGSGVVDVAAVLQADSLASNGLIVTDSTSDIRLETLSTAAIRLGKSADSFITIAAGETNQWHAHPNDLMLDTAGTATLGDAQSFGNGTIIRTDDANQAVIHSCFNQVPLSAALANNQLTFYADEATTRIKFKFRDSAGNIHIGDVGTYT